MADEGTSTAAGLLAGASRYVTMTHIRHVRPTKPQGAGGVVGHVYRRVEQDFGMLAPPIALHSPAPDLIVAGWLVLRESLLVTGALPRAAREAVAAGVSLRNRCPYCVDVHGSALQGLLSGPDARAVAEGRLRDVADDELRSVARWAHEGGPHAAPPAWSPLQLAEGNAVAVAFEYLNRMVNVFLQPSPLPAGSGRAGRWVGTRVMGRLARRAGPPGTDLDLLAPALLPADMSWLRERASLAEAYARATAAFERAGENAVPPEVRDMVIERLTAWAGRARPLTGAECDDAVDSLRPWDRSAGRLALTAAVSSYRVTDAMVADFRRGERRDRELVELVGWSAFTAARQAGAWRAGHSTPRGEDARCPVRPEEPAG